MTTKDPYASLAKALDSADTEERRQATARLGRGELEAALPLLIRALGDEDWRVRKEATLALRSFGSAPRTVRAMVELFTASDDVGLRNAAVEVLAASGPAATPALAAAFGGLDADGKKLAIEALGRARDPLALGVLEAALGDRDDNVRQGALEAVSQIGPLARDRVMEILFAHLDDRDRIVRLTALEGLGALEVPIPWARLAPLVEDPTLRPAALAAAALSESPDAARALAGALAHARGGAFSQALVALARLADGRLGHDDVAAAIQAEGPTLSARLVDLARDPADPERRAIALKLAAIAGAPGAVDAAIAGLTDELLADTAERALLALGSPGLPAMLARLGGAADRGADIPAEARAALVTVVASIAQDRRDLVPEVLGALRAATALPESQVASSALFSLSRLGEAADLRLAADLTLSAARPVAIAAEAAVAALAGRFTDAARSLADALARDSARALPAAILIGVLGGASAFEERDAVFLASAATGGDTRARRAAVDAVSELASSPQAVLAITTAVEVLGFALADEEHEVRLAAARGLGRLCAVAAARAGEILDLVDRTGAPDLMAAAVRAIGEGMSLAYQERRSVPPAPPDEDLVASLAQFARGAAGPVAIAAVEALGLARLAGSAAAATALTAALDHPDVAVVKSGLLTLAVAPGKSRAAGRDALDRGLGHASPSVRIMAVEILAESGATDALDRLARHLSGEQDREVRAAIEQALNPASHDDSLAQSGSLPPRSIDLGRGEGGR